MLNSIKDCIYKYIDLSPICKLYYYTPEVQRLGNIHQLGISRKVFPSANHTRLEHSLGVMYLSRLVGQRLGISGRVLELIELAGLLHDAGHFPYSHLFDVCLKTLLKQNALPDNVLVKHEDRSVYILRVISDRLNILSPEEVQFVADCIKGKPGKTYPQYYYQIVNSKVVDVDKLDYLQRDAFHTGVTLFLPEYIIRCMVVKDDQIAFRRKAMNDIAEMINTRLTMHKTVYQHPKCLIYDSIYLQMFLDAKDEIDFDFPWENDIETLLRKSEKTRDTYEKMNMGIFEVKEGNAVLPFRNPKKLHIESVICV
jgi:deoxynucleoside triphosphate triphosphohydrolase SAMHD1